MEIPVGPLLEQINTPKDLRTLNREQLKQVCNELRQFIIDAVSLYGGHFASGLGVVELTVALHYVFNTPKDLLVWDVGHQAYGHKILTGRRTLFHTNRKYQGLSGFPRRSESEYDTFGTGHSSTSISAVLGMALADQAQGDFDRKHLAVIGDGGLSAGMAFEALNQTGASDTNVLIILNDNFISIDPDVGALSSYLKKLADENPPHSVEMEEKIKSKPSSNFFEDLGFQYFGTYDGNNLEEMISILNRLKTIKGPKLLHITTVKGKGYFQAERDQTEWHATGTFDKITGKIPTRSIHSPQFTKFQDVFGKTILELARENPSIMALTPAMPSGSSLKYMMQEMPDRAIDVGIAEQHAVTLAAGMATRGMRVFCSIYSTFLQRAYDQMIHDVAIQNLPVIFCIDRAGLVGEDGATHQGIYDIAFTRILSHFIVGAPMDEIELRNFLYTAQLSSTTHPMAIRYPRGYGAIVDWKRPFEAIPIGKGRLVKEGKEVAILSYGHAGEWVKKAVREIRDPAIDPAHYDMRFVKPLDELLLHQIFKQFNKIVTIEDGVIQGGFGTAVLEWASSQRYQNQITILGVPDRVINQGTIEEQRKECGLGTSSILQTLR